MDRDDREGIVAQYLEMLLPDGWEKPYARQRWEYFRYPDDPTH